MIIKPLASFTGYFYISFIALSLTLLFHSASPRACNKPSEPGNIAIGQFSKGSMEHWSPMEFSNQTQYQLVELDDVRVLRADSHGAASGFIYKKKIDLLETPLLNWCWRIEQTLDNNQELQRSGDDFSARIYLVVDGGFLPWKTRALNYVWTSRLAVERLWANPYAGKNVMMLAVRSNQSPGKTWFTETRNVYEDLQRAFGKDITEDIRYIDAIAIMTDTDNTGARVQSYYGDIYFSRLPN